MAHTIANSSDDKHDYMAGDEKFLEVADKKTHLGNALYLSDHDRSTLTKRILLKLDFR